MTIRLDQYLKTVGLVGTGGQAKILIQGGQVVVNGQVETRRRKQLGGGDVVETMGERFVVDEAVAAGPPDPFSEEEEE